MVQVRSIISTILFIVPYLTAGLPAKDSGKPEISNLMYTFGSQENIPGAFFDGPSNSRNDDQTPRKVYRPCQDGSGGLCVTQGECPPDLRPETNSTNACDSGLECCFGPPVNDKSCASRGGECLSQKTCGGQPVFKEAVDCDTQKGQLCCILI